MTALENRPDCETCALLLLMEGVELRVIMSLEHIKRSDEFPMNSVHNRLATDARKYRKDAEMSSLESLECTKQNNAPRSGRVGYGVVRGLGATVEI